MSTTNTVFKAFNETSTHIKRGFYSKSNALEKMVHLAHPITSNEPTRSYIPCFQQNGIKLYKHLNSFIIEENQEELHLDFSGLTTETNHFTFKQFMMRIKKSTLLETTFDSKEIIKFLLSRPAITDEIHLSVLTQVILELGGISNHNDWDHYLVQNKQLNLLPKPFLNELKQTGLVTNPKLYEYYEFVQTYLMQQKRLSF